MARRKKEDIASTYVSTGGSFTLTGAEAVLRSLSQLPLKVQMKILGPSLRAAGRPLLSAAKTHLRKGRGIDTSAYVKSLAVMLVKKKYKGERLLRVGANSKKLSKQVRPSNIDSLLEYGHGGPQRAEAIPHLRPAMDRAGREAIAAFNAKCRAGILAEAAKLSAKNELPINFRASE